MSDYITKPGKFEGEPTWVPDAWELVLSGGADADLDDGAALFFPSEDDDNFSPPWPDGALALRLDENENGFVSHQFLDRDDPIALFGVDVPPWIDPQITLDTIRGINEGGCDSGAYMPAVTYHTARETMSEHGDDVLQYIEDHYGELPQPRASESWSGIAVFYLSFAVELWSHSGWTIWELGQES